MDHTAVQLLDAKRSVLVLVDIQARLAPHVEGVADIERRSRALALAAQELGIPVFVTEHCPEAIGPTVPGLRDLVPASSIVGKRHFSAMAEPALAEAIGQLDRPQVLIGGMEAHVCVLQTALGIIEAGYDCWYVQDAAGSRHAQDRLAAIERVQAAGARLVTTEMVLFEWLRGADHPAFKTVHGLIKSL